MIDCGIIFFCFGFVGEFVVSRWPSAGACLRVSCSLSPSLGRVLVRGGLAFGLILDDILGWNFGKSVKWGFGVKCEISEIKGCENEIEPYKGTEVGVYRSVEGFELVFIVKSVFC